MRPLHKTTIVIWSEYSGDGLELPDLAREADRGDAYCSVYRSASVADPATDPDWDGTEFFGPAEGEADANPCDVPEADPQAEPYRSDLPHGCGYR